jgi:hypothetical protein
MLTPLKKSAQTGARSGQIGIRETFSSLDGDVLLTEVEVARILGVAPITLKRQRLEKPGKGPSPTYLNRLVRYRVKTIRDWLDACSPRAA